MKLGYGFRRENLVRSAFPVRGQTHG
jgi:hypothetical protein